MTRSAICDAGSACWCRWIMPIHAYVYRDGSLPCGGDPVVCVVDRAAADKHFGGGQIECLFGGYAVYTTPEGQDFVGVWGARNASRFRRFLRERGAEVLIQRARPFSVRL